MSDNKPRSPPFSRESEMMVLGCMMTSGQGLNIGADALDEEDFYLPEHRTLFKALQHAYKQDKPVDLHLIAEELRRLNKLNDVGGIPYLTTVAQYVGTSAYVEEYCEIVRNKALLRRMIHAAQEIEKRALEEPEDVSSALDEAQQKLFSISQSARTELGVSIAELLAGARAHSQRPFLEEVETRQEQYRARGGQDLGITGIPTAFVDLDRMIDGVGRSNLIILAARPAMGKTAFALNIAENVCFKQGMPVGIFSLEMTADQLLHRLICSQAEVESDKVKTGALSGQEYQRIVSAVNQMSQQTMIIDDQPGLKITDMRARARRMKEAFGIELLIIDYLQLLTGSGSNRTMESRQNEISEISRMLKTLARELNVPVICLSQLSRKVEDRNQHKPMLSDLRESGSIEQDADVVVFLLRRDYYDPLDKPGMAEVIVAKNRHGSVGTVHLTFRKELGQFSNYSPLKPQAPVSSGAPSPANNNSFASFEASLQP